MPLATPAQIFDRIERAQSAFTRGSATIGVAESGPRGTTKARFRLDLDGAGGATLRVQTPAQGKDSATDQGYVLRGARLEGFDYDAGERLARPAPDRGSVGLRLTAVLGGLNDAVGFVSAPEVRERYLAPFRVLNGWQTTSSGLIRRTTAAGKVSFTRLDLDALGRLRTLHVELPGSRVDWRIAYGAYQPLRPPKSARLVEAFTARPRPPRSVDSATQKSVEKTLTALGRLQSATVWIDGTTSLAFGGRRIRYVAGGTAYAYDGHRLTVVTPGATYQGACPRAVVIDELAVALGAVDPLARSVLVRTVPLGELFPPDATVRLVTSSMSFAGQPCVVLDIKAPRFRASVFTRKSDGLPVSVEATALDDHGRELTTTRRTLAWSSVGEALPKDRFVLAVRPGQTVLPLPRRPSTGP